jgi:hypothetical protein
MLVTTHERLRISTHRHGTTDVPGGPSVHGRLQPFTVNLPPNLAKELEQLVKETGYWLSVVDFMREGTVEKLERWKRDHQPTGKA